MQQTKIEKTSLLSEFLYRLTKNASSRFGMILLALILLAVVIGPMLSPYGVNESDLTLILAKPSAAHPFGCDSMGRDILTRLLYGGRYSLLLGFSASVFGAAVGIVIGCVAGYFGGIVETGLMRLMDVWSALPGMMLCILVSTVMGKGFFPTVLALSVGMVPGGVRMIRGQVLAEREKEYVEAAKTINCSNLSIMFRHLLPNVVQPMIIITTMGIGSTIIMAASLSYIGLGIQPPNPEWGAMLADGRNYIREFPHLISFPGIAIALTVFAINLVGDGLRDALDPKMRD
ncbi:MAG: ABC transporter permease [Oscillospiraceae bacterium]